MSFRVATSLSVWYTDDLEKALAANGVTEYTIEHVVSSSWNRKYITVVFASEAGAVWFSLSNHRFPPNAIPELSAADIIGVQPMTSPAGEIFTMQRVDNNGD